MPRAHLNPVVPTGSRLGLSTALLAALTLAALPSLAPAAAAQAADPMAPSSATDDVAPRPVADDSRHLVRKRLLALDHGSVYRGKSRLVGDHWEVLGDGGWIPLAAGTVTSVRLEAEAEREAVRMRHAARRAPVGERHGAQVEAARWMAETGLVTEAYHEVGIVLEAAPDHAEALELLRSPSMAVRVPSLAVSEEAFAGALAALMAFGANAPTTLRELTIDELSRAEDQTAVRAALTTDLRARDGGRRSFAAHAWRRLFPQVSESELARRALLDQFQDVRREASLAVGRRDDPEMVAAFIGALGHDHGLVRIHAAEALGFMASPAAVEPLVQAYMAPSGGGSGSFRGNVFVGRQIAFLQDVDAEVAQGAVIGDPIIGTIQEGASLDVRTLGVGHSAYSGEATAVRGALERITGATPGRSRAAWARWWKQNSDHWRAATEARYAPAHTASQEVTAPQLGRAEGDVSAW